MHETNSNLNRSHIQSSSMSSYRRSPHLPRPPKTENQQGGVPKVIIHSATPIHTIVSNEPASDKVIGKRSENLISSGAIIREILQVVIPALLLALVIHLFLAQATVVYGRSMEPNLSESQRLIIDKLTYRFQPPQRNDIVVLNIPTMDEMLVKRVVGLPGETVQIRNGVVYINGQELEESFQHNLSDYDTTPTVLSPLSYFVLGDNRTNSNDSRVFGSIKREYIIGRVWLRYWPMSQFRLF